MRGALSAEWLKLRKRPAAWVVALILAGFLLLFVYVLLYVLVTTAPPETIGSAADAEAMLDFLLPASLAGAIASNVSQIGGALALVLGTLVIGSEYGWRTIRTIALQRPSRSTLILSKVLACIAAALGLVLVGAATSVVGSYVVATFEGGPYSLPPAGEVLRAGGIVWLVLSVWALLGLALGTLVRGTGLAIGVGLTYLFVVESAFGFIPDSVPVVRTIRRGLIGPNATALTETFESPDAFSGGLPTTVIDPLDAVVVLLVYATVAAAIATGAFTRRELA